jgi:sensor histidine kinase regulating citrate/malate metabolism
MSSRLFQWSSLKTRVTLFTLVFFVLSIGSLTFYISHLLKDDMQRVLGDQQFATASFIAAEVNDELRDRLAALELVAKLIDANLMGNPVALQARLEQRSILQSLFNGGIFVTGSDGTAIASIPLSVERVGINYMDRDSVAISLKEGKTVISRPVIGKKLGAPLFTIAAPIRDAHGKVTGTLVGVVDLGRPNFLDKITDSGYGKTGGYLLVAPQHNLFVTATDKSRCHVASRGSLCAD